jgi:hypothetical protein
MALSPAPHTPPVFRVLKQAWREYLSTGGGLALTISNPPAQLSTAATTVTGTVTADVSVPRPIMVTVKLMQSTLTRASQTVGANAATGAFTATFPASTLTTGTATASAVTTLVAAGAVTSSAFTIT